MIPKSLIVTFICTCFSMVGNAVEDKLTPITQDLPARVEDPTAMVTNELTMLDTLIAATQQSLDKQKALREQIKKYQELQRLYLQNTEDNELLLRMVKQAQKILEGINENRLMHNFDPTFVSELNLFSQIASKYGVPKP
jgi:hypothetical protein